MSKPSKPISVKLFALAALTSALACPGQYVGKVEQGALKKPVLRATAVYEYTGSLTKPNASRLVPVVVWDGERYQPGGLYLAQPEPLALAPGTQYVLQQSGVPAGTFNISSAGKLGSSWVGLGRVRPEAPAPPLAKLKTSKTLPVLTGGTGKGKAEKVDDGNGPVLHRKAGSEGDAAPSATGSGSGGVGTTAGATPPPSPDPDPDRPTLHRRDSDTAGGGSGSASKPPEASPGSSSPAPDADRPTLHRKDSADGSQNGAGTSSAPDPDRPTLHRHADNTVATTAPDPDRPHLRYGQVQDETRVLPLELKDTASGAAPGSGSTPAAPIKIGQVVAISDTESEDAHPFAYAWPSPAAQTTAQAAMHGLALAALNTAAQATFGPAAQSDAALRRAAGMAGAGFGPGTKTARKPGASSSTADPLLDPQFQAYELSYGGGTTYVYTAHTAPTGHDRRYVTVIAQPDFYGKPQVAFSQTTRGDTLAETPALHLIDAADVTGTHRAELLFDEQTAEPTLASGGGSAVTGRNFALFRVAAGQATEVYTSWSPNAAQ